MFISILDASLLLFCFFVVGMYLPQRAMLSGSILFPSDRPKSSLRRLSLLTGELLKAA